MAGSNGQTKIVVICMSAIGCVAIVSLVLIFIFVPPEYAVIYAGLLTTLLATIITGIWNRAGIRQLTLNTNSKMDQLVEATKTIAYAAGVKAGERHDGADS